MQCPSCNQAANLLDIEDFGMCCKCHDQVMNDQADFDNSAFDFEDDELAEIDSYNDYLDNYDDGRYDDGQFDTW